MKIIRVPIHAYYSGRSIYKRGFFKYIDSLEPDVLYVHGEDTYIGVRSVLRLKKFKYPILFDDHMVDIASVNKLAPLFRLFYRKILAPIIIKRRVTVIRTMEDDFVFRRYGIPLGQAPLLGFGSDTMLFHSDSIVRLEIRKELSINDKDFVFIYAGKLDESKGGLFLAEALLEKIPSLKDITFLIVGNYIGDYGNKTLQKFKQSENNIIRISTKPYSMLAPYFQCADAALFPKQCSLTYFDAQACGLPVVIEDNNINIKRIDHKNGVLFKGNDTEDFREKISQLANMPLDEFIQMRLSSEAHIRQHYNYMDIAEKYIEIIKEAKKGWRKSWL